MKRFLFLLLTISYVGILFPVILTAKNPGNELPEAKYSIKLVPGEKSRISPLLLGFNIVYANESDAIWNDGKITGYLKDVNTSIIRYPGGTVSSFYHWNSLTGEGWKDSWDPVNKVVPKAKSEFMDLDEYMALVRNTKVTPLMGINMSSARRWKRLDDGIKEALDLMKYCRDKNFKVKYWYLDNEPYQPDSNGGSKTIDEYAGLVNLFAVKMKEFDPDIRIIVNWRSAFKNRRDDYQKLLTIAGSNIDIIDAHWYWSWSNPTFEKWMSVTPMQDWTGETYMGEISYFRQMVKDFGYPGIKLASLEWNVGPIRENQITPHQSALIQTEMLMQFMTGGLDMATFWPIQGSGAAVAPRSFVQRSSRAALPVYGIFKFLGQFQGGNILISETISSQPNIVFLASGDETGETTRICLLNKNTNDVMIEIGTDLFKSLKLTGASKYLLTDQGRGSSIQDLTKEVEHSAAGVSFNASGTSVTMLTFSNR